MAACFFILFLFIPMSVTGQTVHSAQYEKDTLIAAAKDLMTSAGYCALITLGKGGNPNVRTMDPFAPENDMIVWLGTNVNSRKVSEIKNDSRVVLYYGSHKGSGYVVVNGNAFIVDDDDSKNKYWKDKWDQFYSEKKSNYILIKVIPDKLEVVDYSRDIIGDPETWAVPVVNFD
jgi:general stress protein 26